VLQCVAVGCSGLQWVAVGCSGLQWVAVGYIVLQCVAVFHAYTDTHEHLVRPCLGFREQG